MSVVTRNKLTQLAASSLHKKNTARCKLRAHHFPGFISFVAPVLFHTRGASEGPRRRGAGAGTSVPPSLRPAAASSRPSQCATVLRRPETHRAHKAMHVHVLEKSSALTRCIINTLHCLYNCWRKLCMLYHKHTALPVQLLEKCTQIHLSCSTLKTFSNDLGNFTLLHLLLILFCLLFVLFNYHTITF